MAKKNQYHNIITMSQKKKKFTNTTPSIYLNENFESEKLIL